MDYLPGNQMGVGPSGLKIQKKASNLMNQVDISELPAIIKISR